MGFKLKGNTSSSTKTARPVEFKVRVMQLKLVDGLTAKTALAQACEEHKLELIPAMVDHPASIFHGYKKSIAAKLEAKDAETTRLAIEAGIVDETPDEEDLEEAQVEESTEQ